MDVFEFALELEATGKAYYERLAAEANSSELQDLFALLADAEQAHYDFLDARKCDGPAVASEGGILDRAKNIFQHLMETRECHGVGLATIDNDCYRMAIAAEEQSIRYYTDKAENEPSPEVRSLLQRLAAEEKVHLNIMENVYEFVESPKYFLGGGSSAP